MSLGMLLSNWDTQFYIAQLEDHQKILETFLPYIEDDKNFAEPWIYSSCKSTIFKEENFNLPWDTFFDSLKPVMEEFLQSLEPIVDYQIHCDEIWLNVYNKGGYQEIHDHAHPERCFSLAYMLELPDDLAEKPGLIFENTAFPIVQSTGLNRIFNKFNNEKFIPKLHQGTLVIFPCWAKHYVLPNISDNRRSTISANFIIKADY